MPLPVAAIAALASTASSGANVVSDLWANKKNRDFSREMYQLTRKDNLEFWNMQNEYNSPQAQMQRFQDAGLNPNLIYGQAGDNSAANIPTPDVQPVNYRAPRVDKPDLVSAMLAHADLQIKQAQARNLNEQTEVIRQDAMLRRLQAETSDFDLGFKREFRDVNADALKETVRQRKVTTDVMINRDAREAAMNSSNIQEAAQRMLTLIEQRKGMSLERGRVVADTDRIRTNISIMEKEGILKDFEIALRQQGINPNDPLWARYVGMFLSDVYDGKVTPSTIAGSIWSWITK